MAKRLIDELYDDKNYQECVECGEMHVCCPHCGLCLKYCHDADDCEALLYGDDEELYEVPLPMGYTQTKVECPDCGHLLFTDYGIDADGMPLGEMYCVHCNTTIGIAEDVQLIEDENETGEE